LGAREKGQQRRREKKFHDSFLQFVSEVHWGFVRPVHCAFEREPHESAPPELEHATRPVIVPDTTFRQYVPLLRPTALIWLGLIRIGSQLAVKRLVAVST
jgi:hypothetical protein